VFCPLFIAICYLQQDRFIPCFAKNVIPTGKSSINPIGTVIAGYPEIAASDELPPTK